MPVNIYLHLKVKVKYCEEKEHLMDLLHRGCSISYDFLFGDIDSFDPNAFLSEKTIATAFMLPIGKPLKVAKVAKDVVDNSKDMQKL